MQFSNKLWPYLLGIFVLNLLQSAFSELAHDEAYYWVYSQHLDWGYFDHPPAIGLLIKMGYALFQNEIGVRLFVVLSNLLTILLLYKITNPAKPVLFFLLLFSCVITHVGFLAVPDIPLLLTVALFFYFYQKYVISYDWRNAVLLGITVAMMGFSKYHGVIVLVSVLFSNWELLRKKSFYLLLLVATILFMPHLFWQYTHDFPTFRFHLFDRSSEPYSIAFLGEYILGQLLIFGPLIGFLLFWSGFKFIPKNKFQLSLRYTFLGILGFFLLSSLKGRIEPNWTAMAMVPLIYMAYRYIEERPNLIKWSYRLAWPSFLLIFAFRVILVVEVIPQKTFPLSNEFHGWKEWAQQLERVITRRPALFFNSYQRAAKYSFYSNSQGFALNTAGYAGNQYDLMTETQEELQERRVALIHLLGPDQKGYDLSGKDNVYIEALENLFFYNRLKINILETAAIFRVGETIPIKLEVCNPTNKTVKLRGNKEQGLSVGYLIFKHKKLVSQSAQRVSLSEKELRPAECVSLLVPLVVPEKAGTYRYRMSIFNGFYDERNDNFHKLETVE